MTPTDFSKHKKLAEFETVLEQSPLLRATVL